MLIFRNRYTIENDLMVLLTAQDGRRSIAFRIPRDSLVHLLRAAGKPIAGELFRRFVNEHLDEIRQACRRAYRNGPSGTEDVVIAVAQEDFGIDESQRHGSTASKRSGS